jgi:hypothetical protein
MKILFTSIFLYASLMCFSQDAVLPLPNQKQLAWRGFEATIRQIAPNTILFGDIGPDMRRVRNENGIIID